jgi:hypothetical protein
MHHVGPVFDDGTGVSIARKMPLEFLNVFFTSFHYCGKRRDEERECRIRNDRTQFINGLFQFSPTSLHIEFLLFAETLFLRFAQENDSRNGHAFSP